MSAEADGVLQGRGVDASLQVAYAEGYSGGPSDG